jgi:NMD protein affecting ribosome stability and mRNA decay
MKTRDEGPRERWREELRQELVHDSYKATAKLRDPTRCPTCGAVYHEGHWRWGTAPVGAHEEPCPACHRIHDEFPAGYVSLSGDFFQEHRDEILHLVRNCEAREKAEHPLERIMAIEDAKDGVVVTTTDSHLARLIGESLHAAQKGKIEFHYSKEENLLRVNWMR